MRQHPLAAGSFDPWRRASCSAGCVCPHSQRRHVVAERGARPSLRQLWRHEVHATPCGTTRMAVVVWCRQRTPQTAWKTLHQAAAPWLLLLCDNGLRGQNAECLPHCKVASTTKNALKAATSERRRASAQRPAAHQRKLCSRHMKHEKKTVVADGPFTGTETMSLNCVHAQSGMKHSHPPPTPLRRRHCRLERA